MTISLVLLGLAGTTLASDSPSPIRKVVTLVEEMKTTVETEAKEDMKAYDQYKCWCDNNGAEKKDAIAYATDQIADLEAFLEEAAGKVGELKTEIGSLVDDIAEDNAGLAEARSVREKETGEFQAFEADSKESIGLLTMAIEVLSKVQFVQKGDPKVEAALVQVRQVIERHYPSYQSVMQKDLYDMIGSLQDVVGTGKGQSFLHQSQAPIAGGGGTAGAKSYNAASGQIVGILVGMNDEFVRDLSAAQRSEFKSLVDFQNLQAAKLAEINAANEQKDMKQATLADLLDRVAKAKEDLETMKAAKSADETFLAEMSVNCQTVDQEYAERSKIRSDELVALADVIDILTSDDARDLFAKSVGTSFLQVSVQEKDRRADRALKHLAKVAAKTSNWALLSLVTSSRLDAFVKVKEALDKLMAELKVQQKDEVEKNDLCKKEIDKTEDDIKIGENLKEDLSETQRDLENTLATLAENIATLKQEVADMEVNIKQAGINRKEENQLFQQSVADQRATVKVLNMALDRLKEFYTPGAAFAQIRAHQPVPGAAVAAPPPKPGAYEKSSGSGGVMQLLQKIISEAQQEESVLEIDENNAQRLYARFVADSSASMEADRQGIAEKEKQTAEASSSLSVTKESQLANGAQLEKLGSLLGGLHADCDYVLKYFDIRQKMRQEEMDAIDEAYAILSGAGGA